MLPKIAIVGRPNVGKSALFNRICKKRIAIVDEAEGITRDRLYAKSELFGKEFELIDTGGIDPKSKLPFNELVLEQTKLAIEEADSLIMVVDGQGMASELDRRVADMLIKTKKPVCLAINKIDDPSKQLLVHEFHCLKIERMQAISASHGWRIAELLELACMDFKKQQPEIHDSSKIRLAIVGRPNVGKSTFINKMLQEPRCVVSEVAGTTRDSIAVPFFFNDQEYTLVDTAGIRKKRAEHEVVDKFAAIRSHNAIDEADVCVLMLDARDGLTTREKKIANEIEKRGKSCVLVLNKWDLVKDCRMEHCLKSIYDEAPFLEYCPALFVSAKTGRNLDQVFNAAKRVYQERLRKLSTGELNRFIEKALHKNHPPMLMGKRLRIYYITQVDSAPPHFLFFVNSPGLMARGYQRYLYKQFRKNFGFEGSPVFFHLKGKKSKPSDSGIQAKA